MSLLSDKIEGYIKSQLSGYQYDKEYAITVKDRVEKTLFFDFRIQGLRVMIEVQGEQHFKFSPFFHGSVDNFNKSRSRDELKKEWCRNNNYTLVYFYYNEIAKLTEEEFLKRIVCIESD